MTQVATNPKTPPAAPPPARWGEGDQKAARAEAAALAQQEALDLVDKLTQTERTVLALLCKGLIQKEVARNLDLAVNTVSKHVQSACRKLEVKTMVEAAVVATRAGVV